MPNKCNGQYSWFQLRSTAIIDKDGNSNRLLVSQIDITEQKVWVLQCLEREKELADANNIIKERNISIEQDKRVFDTILNTMPVGMLYINSSGEIVTSCRHYKEILGDYKGLNAYEVARKMGIHEINSNISDVTQLPLFKMMKTIEVMPLRF